MKCKSDILLKYNCTICNKFYASTNSLWNHNNKFHKNNDINVNDVNVNVNDVNVNVNDVNVDIIETKKIIKCEYCNKIYSSRFSKSNHKKICKMKNNIQPIIENNNKIEKLEKENEEIKNTIVELKNIIMQQAKIHPKTLQKINKQLINNNSNSNNTTNNTINNTIINNTYVKYGSVPHSRVLSEEKILSILNKPYKSIEESIKLIHFNKNLPEYNNILITNMKDNIAYTFDGDKFICVNKDELIDELIDNHKDQIEVSYEEYKDKMREFTQKRLEAFFEEINNDNAYKDKFDKPYKNFKCYKIFDIKMLIYNLSNSKKFELLKNMNLKEKKIEFD
jgi:hypothetical protein